VSGPGFPLPRFADQCFVQKGFLPAVDVFVYKKVQFMLLKNVLYQEGLPLLLMFCADVLC
jgi:hypothetical protein